MSVWLRDLGSDAWRYLRLLVSSRPFGGVVSIASLGLVIYSSVKHKSVGLGPWQWVAVGLGAAVIGGFVLWRKSVRLELSPEHTAKLRDVATQLQLSIGSGVPNYSDGKSTDPVLKEAFQDHFPEVVADLDAIEMMPQLIEADRRRFLAMVGDSARKRFPPGDEGWSPTTILRRTDALLSNEALVSDSDTTPPLEIVNNHLTWGGQGVRTHDDADLEASMMDLVAWVRQMRNSDEAQAIRSTTAKQTTLERRLSAELGTIKHRDRYIGRCCLCSPSV